MILSLSIACSLIGTWASQPICLPSFERFVSHFFCHCPGLDFLFWTDLKASNIWGHLPIWIYGHFDRFWIILTHTLWGETHLGLDGWTATYGNIKHAPSSYKNNFPMQVPKPQKSTELTHEVPTSGRTYKRSAYTRPISRTSSLFLTIFGAWFKENVPSG